jgi:hypothetical protein
VPSQIATPEIGPVPGVTVDLEGTLRLRVGR